jgi:hypothetical protein
MQRWISAIRIFPYNFAMVTVNWTSIKPPDFNALPSVSLLQRYCDLLPKLSTGFEELAQKQ